MIMANCEYKMRNPTKQNLKSLGFKYFDESEDSLLYAYRFPVKKYNKTVVIECEIIVEVDSGETKINVFDKSFMTYYPPFYIEDSRTIYNSGYIKSMENKIIAEFKRIGIKKT